MSPNGGSKFFDFRNMFEMIQYVSFKLYLENLSENAHGV